MRLQCLVCSSGLVSKCSANLHADEHGVAIVLRGVVRKAGNHPGPAPPRCAVHLELLQLRVSLTRRGLVTASMCAIDALARLADAAIVIVKWAHWLSLFLIARPFSACLCRPATGRANMGARAWGVGGVVWQAAHGSAKEERMTASPTKSAPPSVHMWSSTVACPRCARALTLRSLRYRHVCKEAHAPAHRVARMFASAAAALEARLARRDANRLSECVEG